jgi:hypothetical protein
MMTLDRALRKIAYRYYFVGVPRTESLDLRDLRMPEETASILLKAMYMRDEGLSRALGESYRGRKGHPVMRVNHIECLTRELRDNLKCESLYLLEEVFTVTLMRDVISR